MKAKLYDIHGKEKSNIDLPEFFSSEIREDIIAKVVESLKKHQPYSSAKEAGRKSTASGSIQHRRHIWKSGYGRGSSRTPRKTMSRKGSQFSWVGAEAPHTRGGRRAHPPKIEAQLNYKKINKKEMKKAIESAISATANEKIILKKYSTLEGKKVHAPFVVESGIAKLKVKQLVDSMKKILGEEIFNVAVKQKSIRAGKGKMRGRRYKSNAGLLIVTAKDENLKTSLFDVAKVQNLSVIDLASGGAGRLTIYTENAIKELKEKLK